MSLSKKLILVFVGVLISFASLIIIVDNLFADKFYLHEKQYSMLDAIDESMLKPNKTRKSKRQKK